MALTETNGTPTSPEMIAQYVCMVCGERFRTERELRGHGRAAGLID